MPLIVIARQPKFQRLWALLITLSDFHHVSVSRPLQSLHRLLLKAITKKISKTLHTNILLEWSNSVRKLARVYFPNSICVKVCFCKVYPLPANASSNRCKFILTQRCVLLLCLSKKRTWLTQLFKAPPRDNGRRAENPTINTQHNSLFML